MKHTLPNLNYAYDALEPYLDARTMEVHHTKHHAAYVNNLNAALDKAPELFDYTPEVLLTNLASVPADLREAVRNNAGGVINHSQFFNQLGKGKGGSPVGALNEGINRTFGSFDTFREEFGKAALGRFGSGWAWLALNRFGKLVVTSTPNQDNPISDGLKPLLALDVWEHAYYLQYQNRRAEYLSAFWNVVDWDKVNETYTSAKK